MTLKKRIPSIVMYLINLIVLMFPWLTVGDKKLNVFQFAMKYLKNGMESLLQESGIIYDKIEQLQLGVSVELALFAIFALLSIVYLILMIIGKNTRLNLFNMAVGAAIVYFHMSGISLNYFSLDFIDIAIPFALLAIVGFEFPIKEITIRWEEAVADANRQKMEDEAFRKEVEERLRFDGKYTKMFYHYVWKNFKRNWKDYALLAFGNILIFGSLVVGIGMKNILALENTTKGTELFNGLNRILVNAMIPMAIIAIFIFVLLFFYYVKCRARNFGVFLTLGMRRNMLYRFVAIEYVSMLMIAMVTGGIIGTGILSLFVSNSVKYVGVIVPMSAVGIDTYAKAVGILLMICIVSLMAARDIFVDFNVGKSTDLRAIGEKRPGSFRKLFIAVGILLIVFSVFRYQNLDNYENVNLLLLFFIGIFLIIRYGMADYLIGERKNRKYLNKILMHNQLFHKSKTNTGYIGAIFLIHFCILFYFMFQVISAYIVEDADSLFPYDIVCLADEKDDDILGEIRDNYDVEMLEYPALRVSSYDSTEKMESQRFGQIPIQGQHIGISESTYHALKKNLNLYYEEKNLNLDAEGEYVHVIYQQDKSEHAKPTGFFMPRSKPVLHIGQPCRGVEVTKLRRINNGYKFYKVRSEEIGSLTGTFRQGTKENIIVFSDEYFEKAKDFWKTTHIFSGEQIENESERIPGVNIHQGITRLILMNVKEDDLLAISEKMELFEERHLEEEAKVFEMYFMEGTVYDYSVSYHYMKNEAIKNFQTERLMKMTMNSLLMVVFFLMNVMLIIIKLLSEKELNIKRTEFFNCMGMRKKDRIRLVRKELLRYYYLFPTVTAAGFAAIYMACAIHARMYTSADIQAVLSALIPLWVVYFIINLIVMWIISIIYAYTMEGRKNGRSS